MRVFDEDEKRIIGAINHGIGYSRNLVNLVDSRKNLQGVRVSIDEKDKSGHLLFQIAQQEPTADELYTATKRFEPIIELMIKCVTLLEYLEKEKLAVFFDPASKGNQPIVFGMGATNLPFLSMPIYDDNVVKLLFKYAHKEIMPSPSLRQLEKDGFLFKEEIRFKKQHLATWTAISVSIGLGLFGIYANYQNSKFLVSQVRPLIQDRPVSFLEFPGLQAAETELEVINYSGFDAYDISFDLRYGKNQWIGEWMKAKRRDLEQKRRGSQRLTSLEEEEYKNYEPKGISLLRAGQTARRTMRGVLPESKLLEETKEKEIDIYVRTTWKNEKRHTFDRIRRYKLVCVMDNEGKSFTFIPEEIVSREE